MAVVFKKPNSLTDLPFHYCPGCPHGIIHRLVAEVMDELGIEGKAIGVAPVGCAVMAYDYFACDMIEAPTVAHLQLPPALSVAVRRMWYSPIRAMATLPLSVWQKRSTPPQETRISPLSLSTTPFTV